MNKDQLEKIILEEIENYNRNYFKVSEIIKNNEEAINRLKRMYEENGEELNLKISNHLTIANSLLKTLIKNIKEY